MYQTVTIPTTASSVTLTFWYNITSQETSSTPFDVLNVTTQNSSGGFLSTVAVLSNANKQSLGSYQQKSFDMAPYKGQTVRVHFLATTDSSLPTTFRIDDVSVTYTAPAPPQLAVGPPSLNFGSVQVGSCSSSPFAVQHVLGTGLASGTVTATPNPPFTIASNGSFSVSNGQGINVQVNFCPTSAGSFSGTAVVSSPGTTFTGSNTVALTGTGFNPVPTTGAIQVHATLNGTPWAGNVNYSLSGPVSFAGNIVPADFQNRPTGNYNFTYISGGPTAAKLSSITPSTSQTLNGGQAITFNLNFIANPVPIAPNNLMATALTSSTASLTWTDNSNNETGFKIERKVGATGAYGQIGTQGANLNFFNDSILSPSTQYCYRVRAYNAAGDSTYSNGSCTTTPEVPTAPDLVISGSIGASPNLVTAGNNVTISYTVRNQGTGNASSSSTRIQIKNAATNALLIESYFTTSALAAGSSVSEYRSISIPSSAASGGYMVYVILDHNNAIGQSNVNNDIYTASITINGAAPILAGLSPSSGEIGTRIVVSGTGFGSLIGAVRIGSNTASVQSWSDILIHAVLPSIPPGVYDVAVATSGGQVSNTKPFKVLGATPVTWQKLSGPWSADCDGSFGAIAIHHSDTNIIYIGSSHSTKGCGLFKSTDAGQNWVSINKGFSQIGLSPFKHFPLVAKLAIAPSNPSVLYLGTFVDDPIAPSGRVFKSTNGGQSWTQASGKISRIMRQPQIKNPVLDITIDPQNPNIVYVGLLSDGIYKTTDGGASWAKIRTATAVIGATDYFSVLRNAPSNPNIVYASGFTNYSGPSLPCSFQFGDCAEMNGVLPSNQLKTTDKGQNWVQISNPTPVTFSNGAALITDIAIDPTDENLIYASTSAYLTPLFIPVANKGVFKSTNGGVSWQAINDSANTSLSHFPVYKLVIDPISPRNLYAVAGFEEIFRSRTGGDSWESLSTLGVPSTTFISSLALGGDRIYALTSSGIYLLDEQVLPSSH